MKIIRMALFQMTNLNATQRRFLDLPDGEDSVQAANYTRVWDGDIDALKEYIPSVTGKEGYTLLEVLYCIFNGDDRPGAKEFCSMSVSDVVELQSEDGTITHYYCGSIGFKPVTMV